MIDQGDIQRDDPAPSGVADATDDMRISLQYAPVVGIGASAGGLEAVRQFLAHVPAASGLAFVVIIHRAPQHASNLAALLQRSTPMPVTQVTESVGVVPDHVYVIPPAQQLTIADHQIRLHEPEHTRGRRFPIDRFFHTLAETHGQRAAGVVLSGTGDDGALGLKRIKECGGVTLAQDPGDAEHDDMPRNATATGLVDIVAPAALLPAKLLAYWRHDSALDLPIGASGKHGADVVAEILALLRAQTGHDVASYTRSHLQRGIGRRMQLRGVESLPAYLALLRAEDGEVQALLRNLLIGVTHFFRDSAAFAALKKQVVPRLFAGKQAGEQLRVWVAGCATGEEAYSVAMLLCEYADQLGAPPDIRVFATDPDPEAIAIARNRRYSRSIAADVSPRRLHRYFSLEQGYYEVSKALRGVVRFATHSLLRDPPFAHLDLIACRNVLIYLNREAQEQILDRFHFALRPEGYLFLGMSESADGPLGLFAPLDKQHRIFVPLPVTRKIRPAYAAHPDSQGDESAPAPSAPIQAPPVPAPPLRQWLLDMYGPPSVLVNAAYQIVNLSRNAGQFLRLAERAPPYNLLDVVPPALQPDLCAALDQAAQSGQRSDARSVPVAIDSITRLITIHVRPVADPALARGHLLVFFDEVGAAEEVEPSTHQLVEALLRAKDHLAATVEESGALTRELKTTNEELQMINAELRLTAEELERANIMLRAEMAERTRAEQELTVRARQQTAIAQLGLRALPMHIDLDTLLTEAVALVARTLDVEYCKVLELLPDGTALRMCAGVGWKEGTVGHAIVSAGGDSQAGYTLLTGGPVIVEDLRAETRFHGPPLLLDHGVVSGMSVIIYNHHGPFGVLGAHTTKQRVFTVDDQHFLQAIANVLAAAISRQRSEAARQQLLQRFDVAQEDERRRIARELHDQLGQYLTALTLNLKTLGAAAPLPPDAARHLRQLQSIAENLSREVHHLALELRPTALDDLGLLAALHNYVDDWSAQANVRVDLHSSGLDRARLPAQLETSIYRVVQEALTNVLRHAAARRVSLILERRSDQVQIVVEDDGCGFDAETLLNRTYAEQRLGLLGMQERAALVGGTLTIESSPGHGATIILRAPLPREAEGGRHV
jgi:two-component system CheB/CheR fusion protein